MKNVPDLRLMNVDITVKEIKIFRYLWMRVLYNKFLLRKANNRR